MNPAKFVKKQLYDLFLFYTYTAGKVKKYRSGPEKSRLQIFADLASWKLKQGEFNKLYYAMGLNLKGSRQSDMISRREFLQVKARVESGLKQKAGCDGLDYDIVCKDKFICGAYLSANGIASAENLGLISGSRYMPDGITYGELDRFYQNPGRYVVKHITREAGEGVFFLDVLPEGFLIDGKQAGREELREKTESGIWIIQKPIQSHPVISGVNGTALNTTRIVTILNGSEPEYLGGFQAFAANGETTDSWSRGSVYVGIDLEHECLLEYGIHNLSEPGRSVAREHPDTREQFKGLKIPFLCEAAELCKAAHRLLYFNFIIGWDVAITESGPIIVEANEKPGMGAVQCLGKGLRKKILEYAERTMDENRQ